MQYKSRKVSLEPIVVSNQRTIVPQTSRPRAGSLKQSLSNRKQVFVMPASSKPILEPVAPKSRLNRARQHNNRLNQKGAQVNFDNQILVGRMVGQVRSNPIYDPPSRSKQSIRAKGALTPSEHSQRK